MENLKSEIEKTLAVLKRGGLILYPTDTVWGIGCDSSNPDAIDKIYKLKQREDRKSMICLVHDFKMLNGVEYSSLRLNFWVSNKYISKHPVHTTALNYTFVQVA